MQCEYPGCSIKATHVLVDYYHTPIEDDDERSDDGRYFCPHHAFADGRESCHICVSYEVRTKAYDEVAEKDVEMLRTYPEGTLDADDCCSDHP